MIIKDKSSFFEGCKIILILKKKYATISIYNSIFLFNRDQIVFWLIDLLSIRVEQMK